jgi:hypothetical protein
VTSVASGSGDRKTNVRQTGDTGALHGFGVVICEMISFEPVNDIGSCSKGEFMKRMRIVVALLTAVAAVTMVTGCEKEGPAEKAGKQIDQAVEKAGDQADKAADAAGDKLKDAGDKLKEGSK